MTIEGLEKKMSSLNDQMMKLKAEERETQKVLILARQEKLRPLVGMAFKAGKTYFVITDVPQQNYYETGIAFNAFQIPALFIDEKSDAVIKIEHAEVFSRAVDSDDVQQKIREEYEEIPTEEFKKKLEWAFQEIRKATTLWED